MSLVIWLLVYSLLLLGLRALVGSAALERPAMKLLFFPGALAAIAVRGVGCILARAPLKEVNWPWRGGAPIVRGKSEIAVYGPTALGLAPALVGAAIVLGVGRALGYPLLLNVALPPVGPELHGLVILGRASAEILEAAGRAFAGLDLADPELWLFVWLAASVHLYLAPTFEEWRPIAVILAIGGALLFAADWLGLEAGLLSRGWYLRAFYGDAVWDRLSLLVATAVLGLAVALVARVFLLAVKPLRDDSAKK